MSFSATCQRCGYPFDATTSPADPDAVPEEGALSICLACGELAMFVTAGFGVALRALTAEEREKALQQKDVVSILLARQVMADNDEDWPMRKKGGGR